MTFFLPNNYNRDIDPYQSTSKDFKHLGGKLKRDIGEIHPDCQFSYFLFRTLLENLFPLLIIGNIGNVKMTRFNSLGVLNSFKDRLFIEDWLEYD